MAKRFGMRVGGRHSLGRIWGGAKLGIAPIRIDGLDTLPKAPKLKRGRKANMEFHLAVAAVVKLYGPDRRKESNLEKIVEGLDKDKGRTPPLKKWASRKPRATSWTRAFQNNPELVRKALAYSLRMAARVSR